MAKFVICGETFELDGAVEARANEVLKAFKKDVSELCSMRWPRTPGVLDEPGLADALKRRHNRLHDDFSLLSKAFGAAR